DGQQYLHLRFIGDDCFDGSAEASLLVYRLKKQGDFTLRDTYAFKDDTDLPFLSDPLVEGFWRACDFVSSPALFEEGKRCMSEAGLAQLSMKMMPDGQCVVSHRERDLVWQERLRYTKGLVLDEKQCFAKKYEIKHENGEEYLFVEHKSGDYHYGGKVYGYYVFKKEKI
ncbi:MAG: hypothetical protein IJZ37_02020, partial [Clostridia bacterium]|nr:hypothetical protein [Clostridia bacterium]